MKNLSFFKTALKRLHAFLLMLIMLFFVSATAQSKETAIAYLVNSQGSSLKTLVFEYKDISSYSFQISWTGNKVLDTSYSYSKAPWADYASQIDEVWIMPSFKSQTPKTIRAWFDGCVNLTTIKGLENLNTSKVTDMRNAFSYCSKLTSLDLSRFDTSQVEFMSYMFGGCKSITSLNLNSFNTSKIQSYEGMFSGCESLTSLNFNNFDFGNTGNTYAPVGYMFQNCKSLSSINLSKFKNTSKLKNLSGLFLGCQSLKSLTFPESFDTSNVTDMNFMFYECTSLENISFSKSFNTSNVTRMDYMFGECKHLKYLNFPESFNTSNVTNMNGMFNGCNELKELNLKYFNTAKVTNMTRMFCQMWALEKLNIRSFKTDNVTSMFQMFMNCVNLKKLDLHNFNTNKVEDMDDMFGGCSEMTNIYSGSASWNTSASSSRMFLNCHKLVGAISYSESKVTNAYANPTTGYFTKTQKYNVKICGEYVTNANCDDLSYIEGVTIQDPSNEGHIYFDNERNILHLKAVILEAVDESCIETVEDRGTDIHVEKFGNYYVRLYGSCTTPSKAKPVMNLTCSEMVSASIYNDTDEEKGFLMVDGSGSGYNPVPAIVTTGPLALYRTSVEAIGSYGICGGTDGVGRNTRLAIWDETDVSAKGSLGGSICNFNELMIWGMITYPEGATDGANAVELNGQVVKDWVVIGRAVYKYGIFIAGEEVTNINCDDLTTIQGVTVADGGYLRYNWNTKTLEMESCYIDGGIRNTVDGLRIKVGKPFFIGNYINSSDNDNALTIEAPTTIIGNGGYFKNTFEGVLIAIGKESGVALLGEKAKLTVQDAALSGTGTNNAGITGEPYFRQYYHGDLIIKGMSFVGGRGGSYSFGALNSLQLDKNIKLIEPAGAVYSGSAVLERENGPWAKDVSVVFSYYNPADVNLDGDVNISDIVAVINTMAGDETFKSTADVNVDSRIDISDIVAIINVIAGGK